MRRSTAAAMGTLTGAALIVGVRLSVSAPAVSAAPPALPPTTAAATKKPAATKPAAKPSKKTQPAVTPADTGLTDGTFRGKVVTNPYGRIQVSITVAGGKITAADATYPTTADSATINPPAIATLKQQTLTAQSAEVDAVSGATFTSRSYVTSLQAALDAAGA